MSGVLPTQKCPEGPGDGTMSLSSARPSLRALPDAWLTWLWRPGPLPWVSQANTEYWLDAGPKCPSPAVQGSWVHGWRRNYLILNKREQVPELWRTGSRRQVLREPGLALHPLTGTSTQASHEAHPRSNGKNLAELQTAAPEADSKAKVGRCSPFSKSWEPLAPRPGGWSACHSLWLCNLSSPAPHLPPSWHWSCHRTGCQVH